MKSDRDIERLLKKGEWVTMNRLQADRIGNRLGFVLRMRPTETLGEYAI